MKLLNTVSSAVGYSLSSCVYILNAYVYTVLPFSSTVVVDFLPHDVTIGIASAAVKHNAIAFLNLIILYLSF